MKFLNKVVLITGSSRGIGRAIAYEFARKGAHVILNSTNNLAQLIETHEDFLMQGFNSSYFKADVSKYEECIDLFDYILQKTGKYPDILVNNAGISHSGLFTDTTPEIWDKLISTNLNSAYYCSYLIAPHMIMRSSGCIINISSIWGNIGASCEVAYSVTKSGINGLTKALAKELGPSNVRVNAIACGWIDTDMTSIYMTEERLMFLENVPLMRAGTAFDVAGACVFLAQEESSYITGQIITLDGGIT